MGVDDDALWDGSWYDSIERFIVAMASDVPN